MAADAIGAAAFSLAGADWPEDFALLERALRERLGLPAPPLVVNDALGALRTGSPDWTGIAVVSGTYNAVGARNAGGDVFHLGFWPDGAGGRDIARAGLRAVYRAALDMGPATALTERALALLRRARRDRAAARVHAPRRAGGGDQDRLAPVVLDVADARRRGRAGDRRRRRAACSARRRAPARRSVGLPLDGTRVVLTGGVFAHPTDRLAAATMAELPGAVRRPPRPAADRRRAAARLRPARPRRRRDAAASRRASRTEGRSARWAASPWRA